MNIKRPKMVSTLRNYIQFTRIMPENLDEQPIVNNIQLKETEKIFARPNYKFYFHEDVGGILRFKSSVYGAKEEIRKSEMADIPGYMAPDGRIKSEGGKFIKGNLSDRVYGSVEAQIEIIDLYEGFDFGTNEL